MALFEKFPWINFHDLNLNWILEKLGDHEDRVTALESTVSTAESDIDALQDLDVTSGLLYSAASTSASLPVQSDISTSESTVSINKKVYVTTIYKGEFTDKTTHSSSMTIPAATSDTAGVMTAAQVSTLEGFDDRITSAEEAADAAKTASDEFESRLDTAESDIDELQAAIADTSTSDSVSALEERVDAAESDIDAAESDIDALQATWWNTGTVYLVGTKTVALPIQFGVGAKDADAAYLYVKTYVSSVKLGSLKDTDIKYVKYQLPNVTSNYAGLMTASMYNLLKDLESRVIKLEGGTTEEADTDAETVTTEGVTDGEAMTTGVTDGEEVTE